MKSSGPEYMPWMSVPARGSASQTSADVFGAASSSRSATTLTCCSGIERRIDRGMREVPSAGGGSRRQTGGGSARQRDAFEMRSTGGVLPQAGDVLLRGDDLRLVGEHGDR